MPAARQWLRPRPSKIKIKIMIRKKITSMMKITIRTATFARRIDS
jgi:hypothetical protein